jgi:uncharacterized protein (TIGR02145 family)
MIDLNVLRDADAAYVARLGKRRNKIIGGLCLLLGCLTIVAVVPKIVFAETICNACRGMGIILELARPCPQRGYLHQPPFCFCKNGYVGPTCNFCGGTGRIFSAAEIEAKRMAKAAKEAQARLEGVKRNTQQFTDTRDGKKYLSVKIGDQLWMAQNLNYKPSRGNSWCYGNNNSNCNQYGRLYDWETAMAACPDGWHLPSEQEWETLAKYAGDKNVNYENINLGEKYNAGKRLKSTTGWNNRWNTNGNGTDALYFSALPGGYRDTVGNFDNAGDYGNWWTADVYKDSRAYGLGMNCCKFEDVWTDVTDISVRKFYEEKNFGLSVRCVAGPPPALDRLDAVLVKQEAEERVRKEVERARQEEERARLEKERIERNAERARLEKERIEREKRLSSRQQITDPRDGRKYITVNIDGKTWMAENLNYKTGKSWCYGDNNSNCDKYGRLYDWKTAMKACPAGWHLPSRAEWGGLGTDYYGFEALPGGFRAAGGSFSDAGDYGNWWTATENSAGNAYSRRMSHDLDYVDDDYYGNGNGFSVRCVGD